MGPDPFTVCTRLCGARCCRYITIPVATPRAEADWDRMRWWLAHAGVVVAQDDEGWKVHVATPCGNLQPDNACSVHPHHMQLCQDYDIAYCEFTGPVETLHEFQSEGDLADYLEKRDLKRGQRVAAAIRRAARHRQDAAAAGARVGARR